ncbi:CRISPR-associated helicase Cas3' [Filifactor villosus]|uniref:CRISPR-associated helicase Cas3 n=1 Tax=Filifactor villosus TaxID=29374 RepID=A0ABV9QN03_9FIRM
MGEKMFLAKSFQEESIQEHTDCLFEEYRRLKLLYPSCKVNWELLELACLYHDLGKMNPSFQDKIRNKKVSNKDIPHGILSTLFLDGRALVKKFSKEEIKLLFSCVYYHHDRESLDQIEELDDLVSKEIPILEEVVKDFKYEKITIPSKLCFREDYISRFVEYKEREQLLNFVLLKGFLNRIDYAASAHIPVENPNDFLEKGLENFMKKVKIQAEKEGRSEPDWNELQLYMKAHRDKNLVVLAQTGMGKTEAGLWWIGDNKGFFTLPIRTAINAIYRRIREDILDNESIDSRVGLLHSETKGKYLELKEEMEANNRIDTVIDWNNYNTSTRQLSLPLTVCTLDQLFPAVFRYRGYEAKLATLSYSKIIIDEIQMYGPELIGYLICGLKMVQDLGGKFAILTATFPGFLKELMVKSGLQFGMPEKPFVDSQKIRHSIEWRKEEIKSSFIMEKYKGNRVLVICNTVKQCQLLYEELLDLMKLDEYELNIQPTLDRELNLFHAKFIYRDRLEKETSILEFGKLFNKDGLPNDKKGIWITNSIAEASLDIDFDVLITELSDVNGLFQRLGRCFRKRIWDRYGYNCYVFDGGDEVCSGVGYNIDKEIFELSKEHLRAYFEKEASCVDEQKKMDLVEEIYATENMKELQYYQTVLDCIKQPDLYLPGEKNSAQAQKLFRNISSETIIPSCVYEENREEILLLEEILLGKNLSQEEKTRAREKLKLFTMSVEEYRMTKAKRIRVIRLGKYDEIYVVEAEYDANRGLMKIYIRTES